MLLKNKEKVSFIQVIQRSGIFGFYAVLVIVMSIVSPVFLQVKNLMNILMQISSTAIVGVGMTCVIISGNIDLSVGAVACFSGICMAKFNKMAEGLGLTGSSYILVAVVLPIVAALVIGGLIGVLNGSVLSIFRIPAFIMTYGMQQIVRGSSYLLAGRETISIFPKPMIFLGNGKLFGFLPMPIVVVFLLVVVATLVLKYTKFGRYTYALGGNRVSLQLSGVNTRFYEIAVYALCGVTAAIAGILIVGRLNIASPQLCEGYEFDAIAAAVIGGTSMAGGEGKVLGTLWGAIVVGTIRNALTLLNVSTNPQMIVIGTVIIVAIVLDTARNRRGVVA